MTTIRIEVVDGLVEELQEALDRYPSSSIQLNRNDGRVETFDIRAHVKPRRMAKEPIH